MSQLPASEVLVILTRECRDLLDNLADKTTGGVGNPPVHPSIVALTPEERNQVIRDHFAMDNSGYGISIEEWLPDINEAERVRIVNEVLAKPEYNE